MADDHKGHPDNSRIGRVIVGIGVLLFFLGVAGIMRTSFLGLLTVFAGVIVHFVGKRNNKKQRINPGGSSARSMRPDTAETLILRIAKANRGTITPTALAVASEYSLDESKACLDDLVNKGHAELKIRDTGAIFYVIPDLVAPPDSDAEPVKALTPPALLDTTIDDEARHDPPVTSTQIEPPSHVRPIRSGRYRATRKPRWIPADESVVVAGREIGGMVYVGRGPLIDGQPDNAFIDPSRTVARRGDDLQASGMSYWPNYSLIDPRSRATYLAWLASGRSDPDYNVGYMFLYFYGLERRFFLDDPKRQERLEIVGEVKRLLDVYGSNGSVRRYLGSFLDAARIVVPDRKDLVPKFERSGHEIPLSVRIVVGCLIQDSQRVPAEWMLSWLATHPERRLRTPAVRAFPEFRALLSIGSTNSSQTGSKSPSLAAPCT